MRMQAIVCVWAVTFLSLASLRADSTAHNPGWHVGVTGGWINYEGDEPVRDAFQAGLLVGYRFSPLWTLEGVVEVAPELKSNTRPELGTGAPISRLGEQAGRDLSRTSAIRFSLDALRHLTSGGPVNPYLAAGLGVVSHKDDLDPRHEPLVRLGGGLLAPLWSYASLRLDGRVLISGADTEVNFVATAGLVFHADGGAGLAPVVVSGPEYVKKFDLNLNFDPGKWDIKPEYRSELDAIGRFLESQPGARARIEGHEADDGNLAGMEVQPLSENRAGAVRDYLVKDWGIRVSRVRADGFGVTRPASEGGEPTRRIEVYVTVP